MSATGAAPPAGQPTDDTELTKDEKGNLIDPPVIPEYEQRLQAAHLAADDDEIAAVTDEYHKARLDRAKVLAKRAKDRAKS